jgi:uncharacterized membrane protein YgcG
MNWDFRAVGRLLLAVNFVLAAGVVVAGTDLLTPAPPAPRPPAVFGEVKPPEAKAEKPASAFADYKDVTGAKFGGPGGREGKGRGAVPGARSALENSFRVTGTMLSNNEAFNCAVVEEVGTGRQLTVFAGDALGPAKITAIRPDEVEVEMQGEVEVLKLDMAAPDKKALEKKKGGGRRPDGGRNRARQGGGGGEGGEGGGGAPAPSPEEAAAADDEVEKSLLAEVPDDPLSWFKNLNMPPEQQKRFEQRLKNISGEDKARLMAWPTLSQEERKKLLQEVLRKTRRAGKGG